MTNLQLFLAIGTPLVFNTALLLVMYAGIGQRFTGMEQRFSAIDQRFDDMRDLWRAELKRVEEVLDARLKHLEERRS
jgi:hypothetical protein